MLTNRLLCRWGIRRLIATVVATILGALQPCLAADLYAPATAAGAQVWVQHGLAVTRLSGAPDGIGTQCGTLFATQIALLLAAVPNAIPEATLREAEQAM